MNMTKLKLKFQHWLNQYLITMVILVSNIKLFNNNIKSIILCKNKIKIVINKS